MRDSDIKQAKTLNYIGGQWIGADSGKTISVTNPATGAEIAKVPDSGTAEAERAIAAATEAFKTWSKKTALERANILMRWYDLMLEEKDYLAGLMTAEQ